SAAGRGSAAFRDRARPRRGAPRPLGGLLHRGVPQAGRSRVSGDAGSTAGRALLHGLRIGLAAGLLLGTLEAIERIAALHPLLRGAAQGAWPAGLLLFHPLLGGPFLGRTA